MFFIYLWQHKKCLSKVLWSYQILQFSCQQKIFKGTDEIFSIIMATFNKHFYHLSNRAQFEIFCITLVTLKVPQMILVLQTYQKYVLFQAVRWKIMFTQARTNIRIKHSWEGGNERCKCDRMVKYIVALSKLIIILCTAVMWPWLPTTIQRSISLFDIYV